MLFPQFVSNDTYTIWYTFFLFRGRIYVIGSSIKKLSPCNLEQNGAEERRS